MKTLPTLAFLAALVAFFVFPFRFEVAGSLLFGAGLAGIVFHDYRRATRAVRLPVMAPVAVTSPRRERFGLAA